MASKERKVETKEKTEGSPAQVSRRTFLQYIIGAISAFIAAVVGIPVVGSLLSPAIRGQVKDTTWISLGSIQSYTPGVPKFVQFGLDKQDAWVKARLSKSVWVVRKENNECDVFNSRCTHLGCIPDWKEDGKGEAFYCPCHGGVFTKEGTVIAGPPPRPLDTLAYRIQDGELSVEYQDFRLGVPQKTTV